MFERLCILHLGTYNMLKECTFKRFGLNIVLTKPGGAVQKMQQRRRLIVSILRGVNSLLAVIDRETEVPRPHIEFSSKGCSKQINGLFPNTGVRGILERNDYRVVYKEYPNFGTYIDRATGF